MAVARTECVRLVTNILAPGAEFRTTARQVVECVAGCLNADACHLLVYDGATEELVLEATWGLEQDAVGDVRLSPTEGVVGFCFRSRKPVNTPDMRAHPDYTAFNSVRAREYVSLLTVPLKGRNRTAGVLALSNRAARKFPGPTVAAARAVAVPLAQFVLDARPQIVRAGGVTDTAAAPVAESEQRLTGIAVTDGVGFGRVCLLTGCEVLEAQDPDYTDDLEGETARFRRALHRTREEIMALTRQSSAILAASDTAIFQTHLMLLDDAVLTGRIHAALARGYRLNYALKTVLAEIEKAWGTPTNHAARDNLADLRDVFLRLYLVADAAGPRGTRRDTELGLAAVYRPMIVARALLPSQLMQLPLARLAGIVCEEGGATSHTAVLAKSLRIPMLVGVRGAVRASRSNADAIIDCRSGCFVLTPSPALTARYTRALSAGREPCAAHVPTPRRSPRTRDGVPVRLSANIALTSELRLLNDYGAQGIGLYRTEFMCMTRNAYPDTQEQYTVLRQAVEMTGQHGTTIRLLDVGHDKRPPFMAFPPETNPALGLRGLRYLLANPQYLEPHVQAILRASSHGPVSLLLPMVTDVEDVLAARTAIANIEAQLARDGMAFRRDCRLGIMLEVPAAFFCLPHLLPHVDFVSIGTNDLVQYLFAADRDNDRATPWYHQFHPVLLKIIRDTCVMAAQFPGRTVAVCGEMAANPQAVPLLLGAGVRHFSMSPTSIPLIQDTITRLSLADCQALIAEAIAMTREREVLDRLATFAATCAPGAALPRAAGATDAQHVAE
ncbi:MAG: phosphoenolpyruvate--protein phosphotransferase [Lentisphaerae bacterium RIFOXYB12_FULL_65_16]|nr:MAG: phosphoenolpyruvate--protein phosphotransferase [Lentisphaerae bacterium RIFOXYA12_64_32]OGV93164.1 MAG: phosphoenolpyruvate--protein phosphotransferase [Lentisphaerae bacterium RIFOXYB12_FULL_65_16]